MTQTSTPQHSPATRAVSAIPATPAQDGMWFAQSLDPDSPGLTTGEYVRIHGDLHTAVFLDALRTVAEEAQTLQVNLVEDENARWQVPVSLDPFPVQLVDLRDEDDPPAAAAAFVERDAEIPFSFGSGPLFRHALLHVADDEWWWWQCIHHAVIDGYAVSLLVRRTAEVYTALVSGAAVGASPFGRLADVVTEAHSYEEGAERDRDRKAWGSLVPAPQAATLSAHRALPARTAVQATADVSPETVSDLRGVAGGLRCNWAELVIAAHAIYLSRVVREEQIVLGLPLMNRMGSVAARTPAMAMNVVPLPVTVSRGASLGELTTAIGSAIRTVRRHGRYRLADIRRNQHALGADRDVIGPLVNVLPFGATPTFAGAAADAHKVTTGAVEDLTCNVVDHGDRGLTLHLEGNPHCYSASEIGAHARRLARMVEQLAGCGADTPVDSLDIATSDERALVLAEFNATDRAIPFRPLTAAFTEQVASRPHAPALTDATGSWTYAELDARVDALARGLAARGARVGARVGVALPRSRELTATLLAVSRTGAAYLPLELDNPAARLISVIDDAEPVCVVTDGEHLATLGSATVDVATLGAAELPPARWPRNAPIDPAYVIYTSGTTGRPKGVVVPHGAIDNRLRWMQAAHPIGPGDRVLQKTPVGFDVSVWEFFWALREGAELVMADPGGHRNPAYLRSRLQDNGITVCHFVPSMLRVFLDSLPHCFSTGLRVVFCSGEALERGLADDFARLLPGTRLVNLYGPTEAAVDVTCHEVDAGDAGPVPIGRPIWNTRCYVVDAGGRLCPPGVPGELCLGGVQVALGYLGRAELTEAAFVPDPFADNGSRMYRTGDLVAWNDTGELDYLGRLDHQVKLNGQRLEPAEVESALRDEAGASEVAVLLREDRPGDQRLVGYVVTDEVDVSALRARLASRLPHFMVPSSIVPLRALPLSSNGKLDRKALPAPTVDTGTEAPRSDREVAVVAAFETALGVAGIGTEANFFDLGGTSLRVAVLAQELRDRLGVEVGMGALFRSPTPRSLATLLSADFVDEDDSAGPVLPLRSTGTRPPLFAVHPAGGLSWCYSGLLSALDAAQPVIGLQADGLADDEVPPATLTEVAARYVARVLTEQPRGPFRLLGWSVGGVIAHEMAVQLQDAGHQVDLLCLLDAYPADQWRNQATPTRAATLRALLRMAGLDDDDELDEDGVLRLLQRENSTLATLPASVLHRVPGVVQRNATLMHRHQHRTFRGDALMVVAGAPRAEHWLTPDAWAEHVGGELHVHEIDCTHAELVAPSQLAQTARLITQALTR